jgi:hypothetical protein
LRSLAIKSTLRSESNACPSLARALLRKGRKLGNRLAAWTKDVRQKRVLERRLGEFTLEHLPDIHKNASRFVENLQVKDAPAGRFLYSLHGTAPILYASVYGALLYGLLSKVDDLTVDDRQEWIDYINSFQCEDGLYRDPLVENDIAERIDWWGWRHLSAHVVSALTALGGKTRCPFHFLSFLYIPGQAYRWISELPWNESPADVSNTVMNYGVLLQYERDVYSNEKASAALAELFEFLEKAICPETGLWGNAQPGDQQGHSYAVQTSYHFWNLYFYDQHPIPYITKAIDSCLATQNNYGGFKINYNSSACDDIDSIDPLCRFYFLTNYRHADIELCLMNALKWVSVNQMSDGGFVFRRFEQFKYGHELMDTKPEESSIFATWFRMLSIAYINQVLSFSASAIDLKLKLLCPGYQFWNSYQEAKIDGGV